MDIWLPEPGETLLARTSVIFATGEATRVRGMRWFRDTHRNDIQNELPGWPEGPRYEARSSGGSVARNVGRGGVMALGGIIMAALSSAGGNVSGSSGPDDGSDTSHDPADEIEDFPVLWAAPDTMARTLPWQLDPGRSDEKHYRTHMIVTDRRLVIVGFPYAKKNSKLIEDEVLWEIRRSSVSQVEPRDFKDGTDVKLVFVDGSWCRLHTNIRKKLTRHLVHPLDLVPLDSLTRAQQDTVAAFLAKIPAGPGKVVEAPVITRRPGGHFRVEVLPLDETDAFFGITDREMVMDSDGMELQITQYHPDDF
ncbi:hypothetical protein ABZ953_05425 [Streptomyces sp. NPDC046465]|uniref:hypothetical protein n=1 Tax=Streptomyces sp. NPDC046465 TaxID=3155810 RepID=UPI0033D57277